MLIQEGSCYGDQIISSGDQKIKRKLCTQFISMKKMQITVCIARIVELFSVLSDTSFAVLVPVFELWKKKKYGIKIRLLKLSSEHTRKLGMSFHLTPGIFVGKSSKFFPWKKKINWNYACGKREYEDLNQAKIFKTRLKIGLCNFNNCLHNM